MSKEIDERIRELTDFGLISAKYMLLWANALDVIKAAKQADEHGESPTEGKVFNEQQKFFDENEYIKYQPMFEIAQTRAFVELLAENNRQLLDLIEARLMDLKHH